MSSKTARKSQVQEVSKAKVVITDAEMLRQLRINTGAGIFTANTDFTRAALRILDAYIARVNELEGLLLEANTYKESSASLQAELTQSQTSAIAIQVELNALKDANKTTLASLHQQ